MASASHPVSELPNSGSEALPGIFVTLLSMMGKGDFTRIQFEAVRNCLNDIGDLKRSIIAALSLSYRHIFPHAAGSFKARAKYIVETLTDFHVTYAGRLQIVNHARGTIWQKRTTSGANDVSIWVETTTTLKQALCRKINLFNQMAAEFQSVVYLLLSRLHCEHPDHWIQGLGSLVGTIGFAFDDLRDVLFATEDALTGLLWDLDCLECQAVEEGNSTNSAETGSEGFRKKLEPIVEDISIATSELKGIRRCTT